MMDQRTAVAVEFLELTTEERRAIVRAGRIEAVDIQRRRDLANRHGRPEDAVKFGSELLCLNAALEKLDPEALREKKT